MLARSERGRRIVREAKDAGYLSIEKAEPFVLTASQPNMLRARGITWGRVLTLRLMNAPAPRFRGMHLLRFWLLHLTLAQKLKSFYGTVKRIHSWKILRPCKLEPFTSASGSGWKDR